jgi:hypothetical protein
MFASIPSYEWKMTKNQAEFDFFHIPNTVDWGVHVSVNSRPILMLQLIPMATSFVQI